MSFHFRIEIDGISSDGEEGYIHCQKVTGLSLETGEKAFYEGGENTFQHKLPEQVKFGKLSISRAMVLKKSPVIKWVKDALERFDFVPRNITVILLNKEHLPLQSWTFVNCWPQKMNISDLNAEESKFVLETLDFNYQYFYRA